MKVLLEKVVASGFKITKVDQKAGSRPTEKVTVYHFRHAGGSGAVTVRHGRGLPSKLDFDTKTGSGYRPSTKNSLAILKTVEKVARLHLKQEKPKQVQYFASRDPHDKTGRNRRAAIFGKLASKLLSKYRKENLPAGSFPGKVSFLRKGR